MRPLTIRGADCSHASRASEGVSAGAVPTSNGCPVGHVTGWPSVLWLRRVHPLRKALRTPPVAKSRTISSDDATRIQPSIVHVAPKWTVCGVD